MTDSLGVKVIQVLVEVESAQSGFESKSESEFESESELASSFLFPLWLSRFNLFMVVA